MKCWTYFSTHPAAPVLPMIAVIGLSIGMSTGRIERTAATSSAYLEWNTGTSRVPDCPTAAGYPSSWT